MIQKGFENKMGNNTYKWVPFGIPCIILAAVFKKNIVELETKVHKKVPKIINVFKAFKALSICRKTKPFAAVYFRRKHA